MVERKTYHTKKLIDKPKKDSKQAKSLKNSSIPKEYYGDNGRQPGNMDHWWDQPEHDVHDALMGLITILKSKQSRYRFELAVHFRSYTNYQALGYTTSFFSHSRRTYNYRISLNVVKSAIDAACAMIASEEPRIFVLPSDGDFEMEKQAKGLQQFLDGQMQAANVYQNMEEVFRDACIFGDGALYLYEEGDQIKSEQLKADELICDEVDAMYGPNTEPQMIYRNHWTSKDKLIAQYPDYTDEIETCAKNYKGEMSFVTRYEACQVVEAWRKPSTPDSKDGRHVLCINGATLLDEEWDHDWYPIIRFFWTTPIYGYRGMGIAAELETLQATISATMRSIAESLHYFAKPRVFIQAPSQMTSQITNESSTVNQYTGPTPPIFMTPPAMAADVYAYLQWCYQMAFAQIGLSQQQATSQKPEGLDSGAAMRTYADIGTQRFAIVGKRLQAAYVKIGLTLINMTKILAAKNPNLSVKVAGKRSISNLKWSEVAMEDNRFGIQCFPTNILTLRPEGRLAQVQDLINSGLMPPEVGVDQLGLPILNDWYAEKSAARDNIKDAITKMLSKGKFVPPDEVTNLQEAIEMVSSAILRAEINDTDKDRIDLLRRFLAKCQSMLMPPPAPPPPANGPQGLPAGGPPPTAPLPGGQTPPGPMPQ